VVCVVRFVLVDLGRNEVGTMKIVAEMPTPITGRPKKYAWDEWADGQIREVDTLAEFGIRAKSFMTTVCRWAKRNGCESQCCRISGNVMRFKIERLS